MTEIPVPSVPRDIALRDLATTLGILRLVRGLSQSELATRAGITNSAISDYERGKVDPQTQTLQKIVRALGLPLSALDQTQAFILSLRAQMSTGALHPSTDEPDSPFSAASEISPAERELRLRIAKVSAEAGRATSSYSQLLFELLARSPEKV